MPASMIASLLHCTVIICMCDSGHGALSLIFLVILRSRGAHVYVNGLGRGRMHQTGATVFFLGWETIFNIKYTWIHYRAKCKICTKFQTKTKALKQISREIMARRFRLCCPNHQQQRPNPRLMSLFSCSLLDHRNTSRKSLRCTAGTDCIHHKHSPISHHEVLLALQKWPNTFVFVG